VILFLCCYKAELSSFVTSIKSRSITNLSAGQNSDAGASILNDEIFQRLDELGASLRELEMDGRLLEERIRSGQYKLTTAMMMSRVGQIIKDAKAVFFVVLKQVSDDYDDFGT